VKSRPRVLARCPSIVLLVTVVVLATGSALAQQPGFRVNHSVARTTATHVEVTGTVQNETRAEAVDVSVTVEAVGATGKSVARGITYAAGRLPAGGTANFLAKVPVVSGVTGYRANVTARFVQSIESP
jgi:hypothetical protein